jgi:hypothetical protein
MRETTKHDAGDQELRRLQLTKRLVGHEARTQTISWLAGYSKHRLATLRRRWRIATSARHRGPAPTSFSMFFRSSNARGEAATAGAIYRMFTVRAGAKLSSISLERQFAGMDLGEHLCEAFEAFHACFPKAELEFDQLALLAVGLGDSQVVGLGYCVQCDCTILVDRLGTHRRICPVCQRQARDEREEISSASGD